MCITFDFYFVNFSIKIFVISFVFFHSLVWDPRKIEALSTVSQVPRLLT